SLLRPAPSSRPCPYTTLFRSLEEAGVRARIALVPATHVRVPEHQIQVSVSVEVRHRDAVAGAMIDPQLDRHLDEGAVLRLPKKVTPRPRIVRRADVDVGPAIVVEVEDRCRHVAVVPVGTVRRPRKPRDLVAGPVEGGRVVAAVKKNLARIAGAAHVPVDDLGGEQVQVTVAIEVGTDGGGRISSQAKGPTVELVVPAEDVLGCLAAEPPRGRHALAVLVVGKELAVAAGRLVVAPVLPV